jgi:hypothetical protein
LSFSLICFRLAIVLAFSFRYKDHKVHKEASSQ